jgi:putative tryptophan/tyrosine transport system substrate-binding protein
MVRSKPDVIVLGWDNQLIFQIAKETSPIPIVAMLPSLAAGHVRNIARPEGNITGVALDAGILDILRQAVPTASRVAYLSPRDDSEGPWGRAVVEAGRQSGISIIGIPLKHSAKKPEYREAFETMSQQSADALMFNGLGPNIT